MKSFFDPTDRAELLARFDRLRPDTRPLWGTMDASRMLCHLVDAMRLASGEVKTRPIRTPLRLAPFRWLALRMPLPKGAPTIPQLLATKPADWEGDVTRFRSTAHQLAATPEDQPLGDHPLLGVMSRRTNGELLWKHFDHHARQFGL